MENASRALGIAAGVLLGVMIMALVAHFFSSIGLVEVEEDQATLAEQSQKFNMEYEAYNKSLMYGVDVISCLNKAQSNNEKYVDQNGFYVGLTGTTGDYKNFGTSDGGSANSNIYLSQSTDFTVDVEIHFLKPIEENVTVSCFNKTSKKISTYYGTPDISIKEKLNKSFSPTAGYSFLARIKKENPSIDINNIYTSFTDTTTLYDAIGNHNITSTANIDEFNYGDSAPYYSLIFDQKERIVKLLGLVNSDNMKITIMNTGEDTDLWKSMVWETAMYNFKQKRFKCVEMNYSSITGRVKQIKFQEVNS